MRILVCGDEDWTDIDTIVEVLTARGDGHTLIAGDLPGVETQARAAAAVLKWEVDLYETDPEGGTFAVHDRNERMATESHPDLVFVFWRGISPGPLNMIQEILKHGVNMPILVPPRARPSHPIAEERNL